MWSCTVREKGTFCLISGLVPIVCFRKVSSGLVGGGGGGGPTVLLILLIDFSFDYLLLAIFSNKLQGISTVRKITDLPVMILKVMSSKFYGGGKTLPIIGSWPRTLALDIVLLF